MASLPTSNEFTDSGVTQATFKTKLTQLRDYLAGLLGTTGSTADALTALGAASVSYVDSNRLPPRRNLLINGSFQIDQINNYSSGLTGGSSFDGWDSTGVSAGSNSNANPAIVVGGGPTNDCNYYKYSRSSAIAAGVISVHALKQNIEGSIFKQALFGTANAKVLTLSFYVNHSVIGDYSVALSNGTYTYVTTYTVNAASVWEKKEITLTSGCTLGTWPTTEGSVGATLFFDHGNSTTTASTEQWNSNTTIKKTGTVDMINTTGTFKFSQVQLEIGSKATIFESLPYNDDLKVCERYYEKSYDFTAAIPYPVNTTNRSYTGATSNTFTPIFFRTQKCKVPTSMTVFSTNDGSGGNAYNLTTSANTAISLTANRVSCTPSLAATSTVLAFHYIASARV